MNFLSTTAGRVKGAWKSLFGSAVTPAQWLTMADGSNQAGAELTDPLVAPTVYACISKLAGQVASIPKRIVIGDRDSMDVIEGGPLIDLLNQPHPELGAVEFWELLTAYDCLRGECFLVAVDDSNGIVNLSQVNAWRDIRRLVPLNPDLFWPLVVGNELQSWRYTGSSILSPVPNALLLPEEVIHFRRPNPTNFWRGYPPLRAFQLAAETDFAAGQFTKGMMMNNADMGLIVKVEAQLSDDQREQMLSALRERKRKAGTADRPIILENGASIEKPTIASANLEVLSERKFNRQVVCMVLGVPQEILGFSEDANKSVSAKAYDIFIDETVAPLCARMEAPLQRLCRAFAGAPHTMGKRIKSGGTRASAKGRKNVPSLFFDIDAHPNRQERRRARFDAATKAFQGMGIPLCQVNEIFGLGIDCEELPHGDNSYLPMTLENIGTEQEPTGGEAAEPTASEDNQSDDTSKPGDTVNDAFKRLAASLNKLAAIPAPAKSGSGILPLIAESRVATTPQVGAAAKGHSQAYLASVRASEKKKAGRLTAFFLAQKGRVMRRLKERYGSKAGDAGIDALWNASEENRLITETLNKFITLDLAFGAAQLSAEVGIDFSLPPSDATAYLLQRQNRITGINQTTWDDLKASLTDGLSAGDSFEGLAERVREVYAEATQSRAEMIAITETNTAVNSGRWLAMKDSGLEYKAWITSHLEGTRPTHTACEKEGTIAIDETFSNGLRYPGDPDGPPGEVINCRCHLIAVPNPDAVASYKCERLSFGAYVNTVTTPSASRPQEPV